MITLSLPSSSQKCLKRKIQRCLHSIINKVIIQTTNKCLHYIISAMPVFCIFHWDCLCRCVHVLFIKRLHLHSDSMCFPDADRMEVETPTLNETTLLANEEKAFALEPVAITRRHNQTTLNLCSFNSQMSCILCKHLLRCCHNSWRHPPEIHHYYNLNIAV